MGMGMQSMYTRRPPVAMVRNRHRGSLFQKVNERVGVYPAAYSDALGESTRLEESG